MCSQIDWFSSQPGLKVFVLPISYGSFSSEAFTKNILSFLSTRSLFIRLRCSFAATDLSSSTLSAWTCASRNNGSGLELNFMTFMHGRPLWFIFGTSFPELRSEEHTSELQSQFHL